MIVQGCPRPIRFFNPITPDCHSVKTSNESSVKGLRCSKIRVGDREGASRTVHEMHMDGFSDCYLPFCRILLRIYSLPSVFSHGRTQFHTSEIVPLRSLKNGDRWLFSYGRTTTSVRTRRYGGADASVRSQSQVLLTVKRGTADALFVLERMYLCKLMFV